MDELVKVINRLITMGGAIVIVFMILIFALLLVLLI